MKKIIMMFSMILVCMTTFLSCSEDDNNNNTSQNQIVGKWKSTAQSETKNGIPVTANTGDVTGRTAEFNSNLSYTIKKGDVIEETGTYITSGGTITITVTGKSESENYTFNITDNKLYIYAQSVIGNDTYITESISVRVN